ncbi:Tyrosine phosphatase [Malassezia pachydermatis]|uniref:diphosphoinositol-polyphosphate diphosphatase n=1 Tax=Malassezia pachydermatis TaxID=77020 RepID=A0A0M8MNZ1_9BASI|nr:Tyrosine phosphatase [Malassezia pachydermatis]KOS15388.1 Tyrosine phosphatase [Malassezia pachydermatis]
MAAAMDVGVPQVPIDYTALLCRIPDSNATIPDPPSSLDFLHRILREKSHAFEEETEEDVPSEPNDEREDKHTLTNASHDDVDTELVPPDNFAMVNSWVYRSSFPKKKHFPFLKTLGLRSVLTLILEDYPEQNINFLDENGIKFFQYGIPGNKEPFVQIPGATITAALVTILDKRNHPMLIHCNKGKHRTGCLIGCLRKLQQWSLTTIFDEYRRFSFPKSRSMDQEFIELYNENAVWPQIDPNWLPHWTVLSRREILARITHEKDEKVSENEVVRGM